MMCINGYILLGYVLVDIGVVYNVECWCVVLNVKNIFNMYYYVGGLVCVVVLGDDWIILLMLGYCY